MKIAATATAVLALVVAAPASALTMHEAKRAAAHYASGSGAKSYAVSGCHRRSAEAVSCVIDYTGVAFSGSSDWTMSERVWIVERRAGVFVDSLLFGDFRS